MNAALYARVSTQPEKGLQDPQNQVPGLEQLAESRGFPLVARYIDRDSAGEGKVRPQFNQLMEDARLGKFQVVLFWSLDRFSREGVWETLNHLRCLDHYGVGFLSYTEQYLDSTGIFKDAIIAIIAAMAKQERVRMSERVKAGIARVKSEGRKFGGKPIKTIDPELLRLAVDSGKSLRAMAAMFNCSHSLIAGRIKELNAERPPQVPDVAPTLPGHD